MSKSKFKNPVVKWIDHRLPVFSFMDHELNHYPTPKNLMIKIEKLSLLKEVDMLSLIYYMIEGQFLD